MVMRTASVAEIKARLSEFLAAARAGDDVVITDRGRPVARLTGLGPEADDARMAELLRAGKVRAPRRTRRADRPPPVALGEALDTRMLEALLREREEGR
jgi:prevent-host-death family protein